MEKHLFEKEWKEAVLIRKDNKSIVLVLDEEELEIYCPEAAMGNINEKGKPCLVSGCGSSENGKYKVMAFSLDNLNRANKDWICVKPNIFEDAVGFFIASHQMEEMVSGCKAVSGKSNKGKTEPDFVAGDAYIEFNVSDAILNAADGGQFQIKSLLLTAEKLAKFRNLIAELINAEKKIIFLTLFQHSLNDKMHDFFCKALSRFFGMDMDEKTESWIADLKLEPDGIRLLAYQNITERVMLE